jgi:hypothetical protein
MKTTKNPPAVGAYGIDWNNVDLDSPSESDSNLIEPLTFDALLLEISCNLPDINPATVRAQFYQDLHSRVIEAREIFEANLANIVAHARKERAKS